MDYSLLGPTGVSVSKICLGTATFGVAPDPQEAERVVHAALDLGINFFDTASAYRASPTFDRPGVPPAAEREPAEQILGRALAGRRDDVVIATKSGERRFDPAAGLSRRYIVQQVEHSLRRLSTDYIDLYYVHAPDPHTPLERTLSVYDDLVRQGKLRYVALSNHPAWQVIHALWIADARRLATAPVGVQVKYNLIDRAAEDELAPACLQFGLSILPFDPLHGGLLAGTQIQHSGIHGDKRIGRAAERLSRDWGLQPCQVSLAWLLSRPAVASAIVGAATVDEITANATAADVVLEQAHLEALTALRADESPDASPYGG